ncbi:Basic-leucine zipper domain-containing protein [Dioscorea alata]|uniref:Basic-leucine zipper domain-containing protein n=1 Tax=Dioscorea alata TaxID=55571 RepID=A0ACB7V5T9_DIOAL|nr:Basic-leucine zipper domain-containing protein [Dioscorea alata]
MEELWKDINLPSTPSLPLNQHRPNPQHSSILPSSNPSSSTGIILQDFLAGTFRTPPPPPPPPPLSSSSSSSSSSSITAVAHSLALKTLQPPVSLSLNSSNFGIGSRACSQKRGPPAGGQESSSADRRQRRMIKNRESAASLRKQAYTKQLEKEIASLADENSRLKKENEKMGLAIMCSNQDAPKIGLQRSTTAPF